MIEIYGDRGKKLAAAIKAAMKASAIAPPEPTATAVKASAEAPNVLAWG